MIKKIILATIVGILILGVVYHKMFIRVYQAYQSKEISLERAKYYLLTKGLKIEDITQKIITDNDIPPELKEPFINGERRLVIFKYPSDDNEVGGYFSYLTNGEHPTIIVLRGGNGYYGIMRPNNNFSLLEGYNVIGTLYRGNIYGGKDKFGGDDVNDVANLIHYFPQIEAFTHKKMKPPFAMIGLSRGAMEMFIAISRFDEIKKKVSHAISISGNLDLQITNKTRSEMHYLFEQNFKKSEEQNLNAWINSRDPVYNAKFLPKSLKVLIIYGLSDNRVPLEEQESFQQALKNEGIESRLITISDGDHSLGDHFSEVKKMILNFLQE